MYLNAPLPAGETTVYEPWVDCLLSLKLTHASKYLAKVEREKFLNVTFTTLPWQYKNLKLQKFPNYS